MRRSLVTPFCLFKIVNMLSSKNLCFLFLTISLMDFIMDQNGKTKIKLTFHEWHVSGKKKENEIEISIKIIKYGSLTPHHKIATSNLCPKYPHTMCVTHISHIFKTLGIYLLTHKKTHTRYQFLLKKEKRKKIFITQTYFMVPDLYNY